MEFLISALPREVFAPLFGMSDEDLRGHRAQRDRVSEWPGTPCRISLEDAAIGEEVILVNYTHQEADTPFHASHAVYVRVNAEEARPEAGEIPEMLRCRLLSVRGFDGKGMMRLAEVTPGDALEAAVEDMFARTEIAYLHVHTARQGCYLARVDRIVAGG